MKNFFYIILITLSACSPNEDHTIKENQDPSLILESVNLETEQLSDPNAVNLILAETFENSALRNDKQAGDFYLEHAVDHNFQLEQNLVREGSTAGRFEIRKDDPKLYGGHRSEMAQIRSTTLEEGWYGFSQYFPYTYSTDSTEEVVGQWHDIPDDNETAARSPSNQISTGNGRLKWTTRWDSRSIQTNNITEGYFEKDLGEIPKNKWIDWVVHIKFSNTNTGIIEVWMDGVKVIDRQNLPNSYNHEKYPYFKFGVYRWEWGTSVTQRVIYYDEVRVGNKNSSYDEVKPGGLKELEPGLSESVNMRVNSYTVDCVGEMEGICLLVQEGDMIGTENWENFYYYNSIEGFTYEPGFVYGLMVNKTEEENPQAGASSIKYELVKIVSKELHDGSQEPFQSEAEPSESEPADADPSELEPSEPVSPGNRDRGINKRSLKN